MASAADVETTYQYPAIQCNLTSRLTACLFNEEMNMTNSMRMLPCFVIIFCTRIEVSHEIFRLPFGMIHDKYDIS